jgi:hypothetical protein
MNAPQSRWPIALEEATMTLDSISFGLRRLAVVAIPVAILVAGSVATGARLATASPHDRQAPTNSVYLPYVRNGTALGEWRCWDDGTPDPCHNVLVGVSLISSTDGWAVGNLGVILHWDGARWQVAPSPTTGDLTAVDMVSGTEGWAVGKSGAILRWDGVRWAAAPSPTNADLAGVAMVSATDGWAVGTEGTTPNSHGVILRWNGATWSVANQAPGVYFAAVATISPTAAWAVGWGVEYRVGLVYRWDGTAWSWSLMPGSTPPLHGVAAVSADDLWAVGERSGIYHSDGGAWLQVSSPVSVSLASVAMTSAADGWAVGYDHGSFVDQPGREGVILHWDGTTWSASAADVPSYLTGVAVTGSGEAWAVGQDYSDSGTLMGWDGRRWQAVNNVRPDRDLNALDFASPTDGWAVGQRAIWRWGDGVWSKAMTAYDDLNDVAMVGASDGWAVGASGAVLHWDGERWAYIVSPTPYNLRTVSMVSASDGWAAGDTMLHWDGRSWSRIQDYGRYPGWITSLDALSPTDAWAVGGEEHGLHECLTNILHWDGEAWQNWPGFPTGVAGCLLSVAMVSPTDGWAVSEGGTSVMGSWSGGALRWDGEVWSDAPLPALPVATSLNSVYMVSADDGWIAGRNGDGPFPRPLMLHWNGRQWSSVQLPATYAELSDVAFTSAAEGWAVSHNGIILHYEAP